MKKKKKNRLECHGLSKCLGVRIALWMFFSLPCSLCQLKLLFSVLSSRRVEYINLDRPLRATPNSHSARPLNDGVSTRQPGFHGNRERPTASVRHQTLETHFFLKKRDLERRRRGGEEAKEREERDDDKGSEHARTRFLKERNKSAKQLRCP